MYLFDVQRYFLDLNCLSPPWVLLFMNKSMRVRLLSAIRRMYQEKFSSLYKSKNVTVFISK